jgi:hypothetical protein
MTPMRKAIHYLLALPILFLTCSATPAQDAHKVLDEYIKAAGGAKTLAHIQTLSLSGNFSADSDKPAGTFTLIVKQPNRYYLEIRTDRSTLIEAYNGKSAWHQVQSGEISTLLGEEALQIEAAGQYYNTRFQNLQKRKIGVALKGHETIRGRDSLQVELTFPTGVPWEADFDAQTHLLSREKATIAGVAEEIFYDDYRGTDGVKIPYKIELRRGSENYVVNITESRVNGTVGERVFDFPKKLQAQLPDLKKLFQEIDANQKQIDKVKENYAGTRNEEETEYDKSGKITRKETKEYTFFYLDGDEISTLVKKDGKPLSESEQAKENEKTQKEITSRQKKEEKKEAKKEHDEQEGKEAKENDEPGIEVFLRSCQFVNPRIERFRGQDVLVFDFEPNPEFKPKTLEERVVKSLAGVIWVDEKAHDVARLEAYFVDDVKFGGGLLANLQKGTSFVLEQAYLNNEVWLPTYEEAHIGVRFLLVKGFKVNAVTRYSDYKRFNVETLNTIHKPKEPPENPENPK